MQRELTIEVHGELYHLRFHNYMGPWEGHQIEKALDLEEVEPPPDGESYESVLGPNQAYLWHEMDFDSDLHALVTADRLERVAQIVRDRDVEVLEGADLLPEPPEGHLHVETSAATGGSYVDYIEGRHRSVWERGPKAVAGAFLLRAIPVVIVVLLIVVIGRHTGEKYETVQLGQMFARAQSPAVQQGWWDALIDPDHSEMVRHEIRRVRYAAGPYMILADGHFLCFEGADEVMPWLNEMQFRSAPLIVDAVAGDGELRVARVRCGTEVLATDLVLERVARLAPSDEQPVRGPLAREAGFRKLDQLDLTAEAGVDTLEGRSIALDGRIVREDGRHVLRTEGGTGVVLRMSSVDHELEEFVDAVTGRPCPVTLDLVVREVFPWTRRGEGPTRRDDQLLGVATIRSASAQNHHVVGRRTS
jgi:hypothetical protein